MENNLSLTGNEARILMAALMTCSVSASLKDAFTLYQRLSEISQVQPPMAASPVVPKKNTDQNYNPMRDEF